MTLWNLIRDFFVINIFGGYASNNDIYGNRLGLVYGSQSLESEFFDTSDPLFKISDVNWRSDINESMYISMGDWLSTTFTIITLVLLTIFLIIFVKWIFKLFSGLLR